MRARLARGSTVALALTLAALPADAQGKRSMSGRATGPRQPAAAPFTLPAPSAAMPGSVAFDAGLTSAPAVDAAAMTAIAASDSAGEGNAGFFGPMGGFGLGGARGGAGPLASRGGEDTWASSMGLVSRGARAGRRLLTAGMPLKDNLATGAGPAAARATGLGALDVDPATALGPSAFALGVRFAMEAMAMGIDPLTLLNPALFTSTGLVGSTGGGLPALGTPAASGRDEGSVGGSGGAVGGIGGIDASPLQVTTTPEPASLALIGTGVLALGAMSVRRRPAR